MSDITACSGILKNNIPCPTKDRCNRFTCNKSDIQSWFAEAPGILRDGKEGYEFNCEMFWGLQSESIMNQLKDIVNGKKM